MRPLQSRSCIASSAVSKSPGRRIRVASTRGDSDRYTAFTIPVTWLAAGTATHHSTSAGFWQGGSRLGEVREDLEQLPNLDLGYLLDPCRTAGRRIDRGPGDPCAGVDLYSGLMNALNLSRIARSIGGTAVLAFVAAGLLTLTLDAQTRVTAEVPASSPPWDKGIQPINPANYYAAIECGKQPGKNPACVFWDTGLCKNPDFTLAMYTPYKMVAYEVWRVIQNGQPPPQPSYQEAQQTRVTIGVTPVPGSKNAITSVVVKRAGKTVEPIARSMEGTGGRFTFDTPAFAATSAITIDLAGKTRTISCSVSQAALSHFR
jgi:hypothetical protein